MEPCPHNVLIRQAGIFDHYRRSIARQSGDDQLLRYHPRSGFAHVDAERRGRIGQPRPFDVERSPGTRMGSQKGQTPCHATHRQRNTDTSRGGAGGGDAGADVHAYAMLRQMRDFLSCPTENAGIAPFQPHDALAG